MSWMNYNNVVFTNVGRKQTSIHIITYGQYFYVAGQEVFEQGFRNR